MSRLLGNPLDSRRSQQSQSQADQTGRRFVARGLSPASVQIRNRAPQGGGAKVGIRALVHEGRV